MTDSKQTAKRVKLTGLCKELQDKVSTWLELDQYDATRKEVEKAVEESNTDALEAWFRKPMNFGTAGLRAQMGAGISRMNDLTVIQATQGLCKYLEEVHGSSKFSVAVGYDKRHNSDRFALRAAAVFLSRGATVHLYSDYVPTPFVPYAVRKYNCAAGIMVTASHNPKEDNGYKVYWSNGAQIIPPHDKKIFGHIKENQKPWDNVWKVDTWKTHENRKDPFAEVTNDYFDTIYDAQHKFTPKDPKAVVFTYTAMHGVGYRSVDNVFRRFGLPAPIPVEQQVQPDPEFPTVKYPNPEEGEGALKLAIETAEKNKSTVILANDPDADRLAVACQVDGQWRVFTGNEIGALFGWWAFKTKPSDIPSENMYMLASTVSSRILATMAEKENFKFEDTLTGFKWMGNRATELMDKGKTVLFSFEEAIGFCLGTSVLDKDGVSASVVMAEMALSLAEEGRTLIDQLNHIYDTYGFHCTNNSYFICREQATIDKIFAAIRNDGAYVKTIGDAKVTGIRDLTKGYDNTQPDNKPVLPTQSGHMITFTMDNGCVATLRTSGTEPKIKYYTEMCTKAPRDKWDDVKKSLSKVVDALVGELLQPEKHGLTPKE